MNPRGGKNQTQRVKGISPGTRLSGGKEQEGWVKVARVHLCNLKDHKSIMGALRGKQTRGE